MPNWACVKYVIEGSKEDIQKIEKALDSDKDWEGDILMFLGMSEEEVNSLSIRGFITYLKDFSETSIQFEADEAWYLTEFSEVLQKLFPDIIIYWYIEEPGMIIYETNDANGKYFPERYCAECYDAMEYFKTEKELFDWISKVTGSEIHSYKDVKKFIDENPDIPIYINTINVIL